MNRLGSQIRCVDDAATFVGLIRDLLQIRNSLLLRDLCIADLLDQ